MASTTAKTFLMMDNGTGTYEKLCDIINYPDMGGTPSKLDTTDLSAVKFKTSILGLQEVPDLVFEANYDSTTYATIDAISGSKNFKLYFGENGVDGIFSWTGTVQIFAVGGGVDEVRKMQIILSTETEIIAS